jgi:deoxyadenosine/deoxycytidine kinase
MIILSL